MGLFSRIIRKRFGDKKFLDWILEKQEIEKEEAQQVLRGRGETRPLGQMGSQWALPKILLGYKETMGPFQGIQ